MEKDTQMPWVTLNSGYKMPHIGIGTSGKEFLPEMLHEVIVSAITEHGYRLIDTATMYDNEETIGNALLECFAKGIKREEVFVCTKISNNEKDDVEGALRRSLKRLQVDYLDLYFVHWIIPKIDWNDTENPIKQTPMYKVWGEMERLVELGLIRSLGVSNCTLPMLLDILTYAKIKPAVNEIELNPYMVQKEFVDFHKKLNIQVEGFGPLGSGGFGMKRDEYKKLCLFTEPIIVDLAKKYERSTSQIVLNWHIVHKGHIAVPKTTKVERLPENMNCYNFKMTEEEYESISSLNQNIRCYDPVVFGHHGFNHIPYFS